MHVTRRISSALPIMAIVVIAWVGYVYLIKAPQRIERVAEMQEADQQPSGDPQPSDTSRSAQIAADDLSIEAQLLRLERETPGPGAAAKASTRAGDEPASKRSREVPKAAAQRDTGTRGDAAPDRRTPSLTGTWHLSTRVEAANRDAFEGLLLGYRLQLTQDGERVTGRGEKRTENGRGLQGQARTPIQVQGVLDGRRLELTFTEQGAERASGGRLVAELTEAGELRGTFTSDAANSRGSLYARRAQ